MILMNTKMEGKTPIHENLVIISSKIIAPQLISNIAIWYIYFCHKGLDKTGFSV